MLQVKPHLMTKHTDGAGTGAVFFPGSVVQNMAGKVQVLLHKKTLL